MREELNSLEVIKLITLLMSIISIIALKNNKVVHFLSRKEVHLQHQLNQNQILLEISPKRFRSKI